jgi:ATP-dependent DNA ligase
VRWVPIVGALPGSSCVIRITASVNERLYELKWDGYRALLIKGANQAQLRSRNDKDLTAG